MSIEKIEVTPGVSWVNVPSCDLRVLCGCPADVTKHLMRMGLVAPRVKNGARYESGPNAILLSDVSIQNGCFCNLSEFPVLQMFYRQGMLVPGHPMNDGTKPLLIGLVNQLRAQLSYMELGKRGVMDREAILASGLSDDRTDELLALKEAFAFGDARDITELVDTLAVEKDDIVLRGGVSLRRKGLNVYEFEHEGATIEVDMNLPNGSVYESAIRLDFHEFRRHYFSVAHLGEGDGWDRTRPCTGSLLSFQGKLFLIDTGPNIVASLTALGIGASDIEGVFQTHAHDDHFAGLPTLARSDHRIKYYASKTVRMSVTRKTCALMGIPESRFANYFEIRDLELEKWNDVEGLEVFPFLSPHPVETNAFYFRSFWEGGYRTYGHLADIISLKGLESLVARKVPAFEEGRGKAVAKRIRSLYLMQADLKKIDSGGGMIHGSIGDFKDDPSSKLLVSHLSGPVENACKEIGSEAAFGSQDILIRATQDYTMQAAARFISTCYPEAPASERYALLNCEVETRNPGDNLARKGEVCPSVLLLVSGVVELMDSSRGVTNLLPAGTMIGEYSVLSGLPSAITYRSASFAKTLRIPAELYLRFIRRNYKLDDTLAFHEKMMTLKTSPVFGDMISSSITAGIARSMTRVSLRAGDRLEPSGSELFLVKSGTLSVFIAEIPVDRAQAGQIFGEEGILLRSPSSGSAIAETDTEVYAVESGAFAGIPAIEWKLLETYERRISAFGAGVS